MEEFMKKFSSFLIGVSMMIAAVPAFAVETTKTYSSGILVGMFLAFCALVVVVQLIPTIILLVGFVRGLISGSDKQVQRHSSRG
jgi:hypothetical protein